MAAAPDIDDTDRRASRRASPPRLRPRNTLPRRASLKRRRLIRALFDRRRTDVYSTATGCIRLLARLVSSEEADLPAPVQVVFAPGRGLRSAVTRNRIKRILRESYRHHQHDLAGLFGAHPTAGLTLVVLFRGREDNARACIPRDLPRALQRLTANYRTTLSRRDDGPLQVT